jgi:cysteinyl-tRNA synthetase
MHEALELLGISPLARSERFKPNDGQEKRLAALGEDFTARLRERLGDIVILNGNGAQAIEAVIGARNAARAQKNFALADALRAALADNGVVLTDGKEGVAWSVAG